MLEEERKYQVDAQFTLPDLAGCVPVGGRLIERPTHKLRATYYDTHDLRLARAGAFLRHRRGDDEPWTVKLPTRTPGTRAEISVNGSSSSVPKRLLDLVTAITRGHPIAQVAVLVTHRRAVQLCDRDDRVAVAVVDDAVSVLHDNRIVGKFREIEVERRAGRAHLMDMVEAALCAAGAVGGTFAPPLARALDLQPDPTPDWPVPPDRLPKRASAGDVAVAALITDIARVIDHDPLVRLRATVGDNDTAVHQMRVGCRRLRSDLRTLLTLLDADWAVGLRREIGWVADILGAARDAQMLRERLHHTGATDPLAPLDQAAIARIDADLTARYEESMAAIEGQLSTPRYHRLLDELLAAATTPQLRKKAHEPARDVLPHIARRPWRAFIDGGHGRVGANRLDPTASDEVWHGVRIRAKRARYAAEIAAEVLGGGVVEFAEALARVQDVLGEHHDATIAADTWLAIAAADPDDYGLAITAGRLYERERQAVHAARAAFPAAWRAANERHLTRWLD